jgi:hypothetical protein
MCTISYFVKSGELRLGGTLRIRTAGADEENGFWDGDCEIAPNDPDYTFWLWLRQRLKRHWFGPEGISKEEVERYREEFRKEPLDHRNQAKTLSAQGMNCKQTSSSE